MKGLFTYGAVASVFLLTAGSVAFAQDYNSSSSPTWNQGASSNQGTSGWRSGSQSWNPSGTQSGGWNQGSGSSQGWNQGSNSGQGWNQNRFSGSSQGANKEPSQQDAYQELSKFGYNNVRNLQRSEGWEAHATKNGDRVHVFIDDDGMIATYRGD